MNTDTNRSMNMEHLISQDLARVRIAHRLEEADALRRGRQVVLARRLSRRAERAALQARLVLARSI